MKRVILFLFIVYSISLVSLEITGTVTENTETGNPLENVEVIVDGELAVTTDASGVYTITLDAGTYDICFILNDHETVQFDDYQLTENEILNVVMLTVDANISTYYVEMIMSDDSTATATLDLTNLGYSPLQWNSILDIYDNPVTWQENNREFGDLLMEEDFTDYSWGLEVTPEGVFGIEMGAYASPPMTIHHHDHSLNLIFSHVFTYDDIPFLEDPAYDPITGRIITVSNTGEIYAFPPVGFNENNIEIIADMDLDISIYLGSCAYDYNNNTLYFNALYGVDAQIAKYNLDTGELTEIPDPTGGNQYVYGMTYLPDQPDGYTILGNVSNYPIYDIYGYNPLTNQWSPEPLIPNVPRPGGLSVTNAFTRLITI